MARIFILTMLALLGGCAGGSDKAAPATLRLQLAAAEDLNPPPAGGASPVWVHLYQLRNGSTFARADFFSLVERGQATLSGDLIEHEQWVIRPGERQVKDLALGDGVRQVGIVVAYRALDRSTWRRVIEVPASEAGAWQVRLGAYAVDVVPLPAP